MIRVRDRPMPFDAGTYIVPAVRFIELQLAATDPGESHEVQQACIGALAHLATLETWIDREAIPGRVFAAVMRLAEPVEVAAVHALRRYRARVGTEEEVVQAFGLLRRALVRVTNTPLDQLLRYQRGTDA